MNRAPARAALPCRTGWRNERGAKMPSRWVSGYQDWLFRFRHSPAAIAATAGAIGLICGALVVGDDARPAVAARIRGRAASSRSRPQALRRRSMRRSPRDAGSSSAERGRNAAAADCDQQAWPYITQHCLTEREASQRKVRVITHRQGRAAPVVSAIETQRVKEAPRVERGREGRAVRSRTGAAAPA